MVFWQAPKTRKQARPDVRLPTARAAGLADLTIVVDSHERYAYRFAHQQVTLDKRALRCGDYAVEVDGQIVVRGRAQVPHRPAQQPDQRPAAVRRRRARRPCRGPPSSWRTATRRSSPASTSEAPSSADGLAELQVRYPGVPIVFCETRSLAEEWVYRYLAAAATWSGLDEAALDRLEAVELEPSEARAPTRRPGREHPPGPRPRRSAGGPSTTGSRCLTADGCVPTSSRPGAGLTNRLTATPPPAGHSRPSRKWSARRLLDGRKIDGVDHLPAEVALRPKASAAAEAQRGWNRRDLTQQGVVVGEQLVGQAADPRRPAPGARSTVWPPSSVDQPLPPGLGEPSDDVLAPTVSRARSQTPVGSHGRRSMSPRTVRSSTTGLTRSGARRTASPSWSGSSLVLVDAVEQPAGLRARGRRRRGRRAARRPPPVLPLCEHLDRSLDLLERRPAVGIPYPLARVHGPRGAPQRHLGQQPAEAERHDRERHGDQEHRLQRVGVRRRRTPRAPPAAAATARPGSRRPCRRSRAAAAARRAVPSG